MKKLSKFSRKQKRRLLEPNPTFTYEKQRLVFYCRLVEKEPADPYTIRIRAKLDDTRDVLVDIDDDLISRANALSKYDSCPFTYDRSSVRVLVLT